MMVWSDPIETVDEWYDAVYDVEEREFSVQEIYDDWWEWIEFGGEA